MREINEQETLPFEENNQPPEEISKHNKRIDDLIEDAEIEVEMEVEKNIRSKNLRMFSISMIGIGLLGLVYFQMNHQTTVAPVEQAKKSEISEIAEESLARQVPVVEDGPNSSNIPVAQSSGPATPIIVEANPFLTPPETKSTPPITKNTKSPEKIKQTKKTTQVDKVSTSTKPKSISKNIPSVTKSKIPRFYVQVGAFGVRKNAESLLKQLKGKGFSPSIQTRPKKSNWHIVTVGSFASKKAGSDTLKEMTHNGFDTSYYKNSKNSFSLKVGEFKNLQDAQKMQVRLSIKGFLSESHKADVPVKIYAVQLGVFPNREKARLTQEKLALAGYPKTFLR